MKEKDRLAPLTRQYEQVPVEFRPTADTPIGTPVRVYRDNGEILVTKTREKVQPLLGGGLGCFVVGIAGWYRVECIEVIP